MVEWRNDGKPMIEKTIARFCDMFIPSLNQDTAIFFSVCFFRVVGS